MSDMKYRFVDRVLRTFRLVRVEDVFGMMREVERYSSQIQELRKILADTPDVRAPGIWWPLGDDSDEFKRGARWAENWWRIKISQAIDTTEPRHESNEMSNLLRVWIVASVAIIATASVGTGVVMMLAGGM